MHKANPFFPRTNRVPMTASLPPRTPPAPGSVGRPTPAPPPAPARQPPPPPPRPDASALAARARRSVAALVAELADARARIAALEAEVAALQPPPPPPPPAVPTITLRYHTAWPAAYAHFAADGGAWTPSPGVKLADAAADGDGWKELVVPASSLEFVLNDGGSSGASSRRWDTPDPFAPRGVNYRIEAPGVWRLSGGRLEREE